MSKRGRAGAPASMGTWLKGLRLIIVQDGRNMTSMRSKRIRENALKIGADEALLIEYFPNKQPAMLTEGGSKKIDSSTLSKYTHVVTELPQPENVASALGLKAHDEGGPLLVKPQWVSKCFSAKDRVPESPEFTDFSDIAPLPSATTTTAADEEGGPQGKKARTGEGDEADYEELPLSVLDDYTDLTDEERQALLAWYGGKLRRYKPKSFSKLACHRPTVRHHANQALAKVFEDLVAMYDAVGDSGREISFARSLSIIRAWPTRIRSGKELKQVPKIGPSSVEVMNEWLESQASSASGDGGGRCQRLQQLRANPDNMALLDLCRVHGVGHTIALRWLEKGYRSVAQIQAELHEEQGSGTDCTFREKCAPSREHILGLQHFDDVNTRIPRDQVARLGDLVKSAAVKHLRDIGVPEEKLMVEIAGSYRRGKEDSGDLDILMTVTDGVTHRGLREGIKTAMKDMGVEFIVLKDASGLNGFMTRESKIHEKLESHQNILSIVKFEGKFRRVDVITMPYTQWAFAVLGWSGTKQLEKDLRDYANEKNMHLSQQAVYCLETGRALRNPKSPDGLFRKEEEIFDFLGLKFLPPCLRWA